MKTLYRALILVVIALVISASTYGIAVLANGNQSQVNVSQNASGRIPQQGRGMGRNAQGLPRDAFENGRGNSTNLSVTQIITSKVSLNLVVVIVVMAITVPAIQITVRKNKKQPIISANAG
jgi:hypothetical protein